MVFVFARFKLCSLSRPEIDEERYPDKLAPGNCLVNTIYIAVIRPFKHATLVESHIQQLVFVKVVDFPPNVSNIS